MGSARDLQGQMMGITASSHADMHIDILVHAVSCVSVSN